MQGNPGDGAIFTDRCGDEWNAIITDESMSGNATLAYTESEDGEFAQGSIHMAFNIPNENDTMREPYYEHRPDADWPNEVL
jgi:hypothetical protein